MEKKHKKLHHGNTIIPPWTISFPEEEFISTDEIMEELDIKYQTLVGRIRYNNFPQPESKAMSGRMALYKRRDVLDWLHRNGFKTDQNSKK